MDNDLFRSFRQEFSNAYLGNKKLELKFLLQDHISIGDLAKNKSGMNLFTVLKNKGLITYTNVKLLSEIADVTENILAITSVTEYKKAVGSQYDDRGGASLSSYRQTLYKAMCLITEDEEGDLESLIDHYGLDSLDLKNKWDLVFHLEKEVKLNETQKLLTDFANQLNAQAKILLLEVAGGSGVTGGGGGPGGGQTTTEVADGSGVTFGGGRLTIKSTGLVLFTRGELVGYGKICGGGGKIVRLPTTPSQMDEKDFQLLKTITSEYYDARRKTCYFLLMVLFGDHVPTYKHETIENTIGLLDELDNSNDLSREDISIIYDTINLSEQYALQRQIQERLPSFPNVKEVAITKISIGRQKLIKFGMRLGKKDVDKMDSFYNVPVKKYENSWSMIYDLECREIIKVDNTQQFIADLTKLRLSRVAVVLK